MGLRLGKGLGCPQSVPRGGQPAMMGIKSVGRIPDGPWSPSPVWLCEHNLMYLGSKGT